MLSSRVKSRSMQPAARISTACLAAALLLLIVLHCIPGLELIATTGERIPYDPRVNFLSEYVRTPAAPLMIGFFLLVAGHAGTLAWLARELGLHAASKALLAASFVALLLVVFPTDLAELRTDFGTCGDPSRVEPCTWVGRVHDILPEVLFACIGVTWLALVRVRRLAWAGLGAGLAAFVLLVAAHIAVVSNVDPGRWWVGLLQRAVIGPTLLWSGAVLDALGSEAGGIRWRIR
jgi:Protein of unknown function (DUF998)